MTTTTNTPTFSIIDYSEKSIALTGDTKPIKDALKSLGGRFNAKLSIGAGWVFPKAVEDELRAYLGGYGAKIETIANTTTTETTKTNNPFEEDYYNLLEHYYGTEEETKWYKQRNVATVRMSNGYYFTIEKEKIETEFWFHDEGPNYDFYKEVTSTEKSKEEYFIGSNDDPYANQYRALERDTIYGLVQTADKMHPTCWLGGFEDYGDRVDKLTEVDKEKITKALDYATAQHKKRLQTYLKRYGTSKISFRTYWADR